jgi:hypothetical protein
MSTKELQAKYDKSNADAAINAAIRAEIPGGSELLGALEVAHKAAGRKDDPAAATVSRILTALRAAKAAMEAEIRRRYGIPAREQS